MSAKHPPSTRFGPQDYREEKRYSVSEDVLFFLGPNTEESIRILNSLINTVHILNK